MMSKSQLPPNTSDRTQAPFADFVTFVRKPTALRNAISAAHRRPEIDCVEELLKQASVPDSEREPIRITAYRLVAALRSKVGANGVKDLVQEYSLSTQEGVALMCLAEALLRIPDTPTRDALIRDKIAGGDWASHLAPDRSLFVNAATWGLVVSGRLTHTVNDRGLSAALTRLLARAGEPIIRRGIDMAMRMMGEQFVAGETIDEALKRAKVLEQRGFRYSYDMLGEAAMTTADAEGYYRSYESAIRAIGVSAKSRGIYEGPGISIKLSALHPRYTRTQAARVMDELLPRVKALAIQARHHDIGFNIDAEEADRLELSLDILESLSADPELSNWNGLGFVVQAYSKRCPYVIDWLIDLARRTNRRLMVRLVKGAYWDAEIKRAQVDGLSDFPVFTRKVHTDLCYIACARKLLAAEDFIFPQFATHNAQTVATIAQLAGPNFRSGRYEFQCLHGMGESLYEEVVGKDKLDRPVRIYAPVGTHEALLAYLVRRLLENGANSSFVNRIGDKTISIEKLIADPVNVVRSMAVVGAQSHQIQLPCDLYGARKNSAGIDLSNEETLVALNRSLRDSGPMAWTAVTSGAGEQVTAIGRPIINPGNHSDRVGHVTEATKSDIRLAVAVAKAAAPRWAAVSPSERAACLDRAADLMQSSMPQLLGLIMREAGKTIANAIAEVREAIDFLRYYAEQARLTFREDHSPLGPVACISPWNFPLAIFTGQVAAALVAGNPVLAKPAEETPLIAAQGVRLLHEGGVPKEVLQLLPGPGDTGATLVASQEVRGVMFTGSTEVARLIQRELANRVSPGGKPIPLIAETGGQNAMIVDSSALAEQVVTDVIASAFDSAGQRCSALRILCLQDEVADRIIAMLKGALKELAVGRTDKLSVDIGPVITSEAKQIIEAHIEGMQSRGHKVEQVPLPPQARDGSFVAPTLIEINSIQDLEREIFGPVLHILRYRRSQLSQLLDDINSTGYGLTFGLHTRLDDTITHVAGRIKAGNIYVNRNTIGAVVGVQPFGGRGLSGTGPKAGGPLYLGRLVCDPLVLPYFGTGRIDEAIADLARWFGSRGNNSLAREARNAGEISGLGFEMLLPGPVGENNLYSLRARGKVLLAPITEEGLYRQLIVVLATGNTAVIDEGDSLHQVLLDLPESVRTRIIRAKNAISEGSLTGALAEGDADHVIALSTKISALPGPIVPIQAIRSGKTATELDFYNLNCLLEEVSTSINTTAAGGNASLMTIE